jgi:TolA-binding protein
MLIGCSSKKTDKELFSEGDKNYQENKYPEAVSSYEELIDQYPESKFAPESLFRLASFYQNKLLKNISAKESLDKSVELFRKIYDDYPNSEFAPNGLFMAGFVYSNEIKNYDKAREMYNLFIEKYPDHELAVSAEQEMEYMGLSPEEILEKNLAKENTEQKSN